MQCNICNKNDATIHIQEVINGAKKSLHICQGCADNKGLNVAGLNGINLAELFKSVHNTLAPKQTAIKAPQDTNISIQPDLQICSSCLWDSEKLKKTGRLGCSECYKAFSGILNHSIPNLHRGFSHVGKKPNSSPHGKNEAMVDLFRLQMKLDKLVQSENYEEAALIRDKIKDLKLSIV